MPTPTNPSIPSGKDYAKKFRIELDGYQIANLRAALAAGMSDKSPLGALNTGDWIGEIPQLLPEVDTSPNQSVEDLIAVANAWHRLHPPATNLPTDK